MTDEESAFIQVVRENLRNGPGTSHQKQQMMRVARQMEATPGAEALYGVFAESCRTGGYLGLRRAPFMGLPATVMEKRDEKPKEEEERYRARAKRIKRAAAEFQAGRPEDEVVTFVCAADEFKEAYAKAFGSEWTLTQPVIQDEQLRMEGSDD